MAFDLKKLLEGENPKWLYELPLNKEGLPGELVQEVVPASQLRGVNVEDPKFTKTSYPAKFSFSK